MDCLFLSWWRLSVAMYSHETVMEINSIHVTLHHPDYDFLEIFHLSICWVIPIMSRCDWLSCFRSMKSVIWLDESIFTTSDLYQPSASPFWTLLFCIYVNQNSSVHLETPKTSHSAFVVSFTWGPHISYILPIVLFFFFFFVVKLTWNDQDKNLTDAWRDFCCS